VRLPGQSEGAGANERGQKRQGVTAQAVTPCCVLGMDFVCRFLVDTPHPKEFRLKPSLRICLTTTCWVPILVETQLEVLGG